MKFGNITGPVVNLISGISDFVYPKVCILSGLKIPESNSNSYILDEKISLLERATGEDLIAMREKTGLKLSFSVFAFRNDGPVQTVIHEMKYKGMKNIGIFLGEYLKSELKKLGVNIQDKFHICVPIPLHETKKRERGYNQSDYICKGVTSNTDIEITKNLLIRVKKTQTQTKLSFEERKKNMKNAFIFNPRFVNKLNGVNAILVDDVITSGSTLKEAISVLKKGGIGEILVLTSAVVKS